MAFESAFLILFAIATAVAVGARWLNVPYTVALVVTGLTLGATHALEVPHLTKDLLFSVILPGLIFEAAFHLDASKFWKERITITSMAVPGLLVAILVTAAILTPAVNALAFVQDFHFAHALVFASLIAATDPIAVVGLFKSLGAPKRLAVLVEGESLLNDGTGVVIFSIVVGLTAGGALSLSNGAFEFIRVAGLGALVGAALGYALSQVIVRIDDAMIELTLTMIAAYGSFVIAEELHTSGVIATVTAGMLCGNYAAKVGMSPTTRVAVETFWEYLAFALNSVVFLLIGFEIEFSGILAAWRPILLAYVAVMAGRALVVYTVSAFMRRTRAAIPWSWAHVLTWSGLRGALSMVLVLGLPRDFAHRDVLVNMTFGVVLLSILVQGLTMAPLMRRLGIVGIRTAAQERYARERARVGTLGAALREIERMRAEHAAPSSLLEMLEQEYRGRLNATEHQLKDMHLQQAELRDVEERAARRRMLVAERDAAIASARSGALNEEDLHALLADIDGRVEELEATPPTPASAEPAAG